MYNFNNYEIIREINNPDPDVEYIMITDNVLTRSKTWKIKYIKELLEKPIWKRCWTVRYNVFDYVSSDICIYLDASHYIGNADYITKYVDIFINDNVDFMTCVHTERFLIMDEINAWQERYSIEQTNLPENYFDIVKNWVNENYDINYKGQFSTNIMFCRKNKMDIHHKTYELMKKWKEDYNLNDFYRIEQPIFSAFTNKLLDDYNVFPLSLSCCLNSNLLRCYHNSTLVAFNTNYQFLAQGYFKDVWVDLICI